MDRLTYCGNQRMPQSQSSDGDYETLDASRMPGGEGSAALFMYIGGVEIPPPLRVTSSQGRVSTIQTMLRWRSDEALKIYARINDYKYADWLTKASQAKVSNIRTTTLAENMEERGLVNGSNHAAFYDSWLRLAAKGNRHRLLR